MLKAELFFLPARRTGLLLCASVTLRGLVTLRSTSVPMRCSWCRRSNHLDIKQAAPRPDCRRWPLPPHPSRTSYPGETKSVSLAFGANRWFDLWFPVAPHQGVSRGFGCVWQHFHQIGHFDLYFFAPRGWSKYLIRLDGVRAGYCWGLKVGLTSPLASVTPCGALARPALGG